MKTTEFLKEVVTSNSNSGISSKRLLAAILIFFGIASPITCIFLEPIGEIDDSILILSAQFLVSGCSLLGFTLKEVSVPALANRTKKPVSSVASVSSSSRAYEDPISESEEEIYEPEYTKKKVNSSKCIG